MAYSKGIAHLIKPNERLTAEAGGLRTFVLRLLRLEGNSPRRRLFEQPASFGGVLPLNRRRMELEASKAMAYENFRRVLIR